MGYDSGKDKVLKEYDGIEIGSDNKLIAKIVKYGDGDPKFSIQQTFKTKDGEERSTSKLGRMHHEVLVELQKVIVKALEDFENV